MEKPQNSIDLFEFSRNFGAVKEQPAKIIFRQVKQISVACAKLKRALKLL